MINDELDKNWFKEINYHEANDINLICFPWGGGNASAFIPWQGLLNNRFNIWALSLPGRENKMKNDFVLSADELVKKIIPALPIDSSIPLIFYGHSMGAGLAFNTITELHKRKLSLPKMFISSGRMPPHYPNGNVVADMDDESIIEYLQQLSDSNEALPRHDEFLNYYLSKIKADYKLNHSIPAFIPERLPVHLCIINGKDDPLIQGDKLNEWSQHSAFRISNYLFPGGHFFINNNLVAFTQLIQSEVVNVLDEQHIV